LPWQPKGMIRVNLKIKNLLVKAHMALELGYFA
jgi:hypothetical protein